MDAHWYYIKNKEKCGPFNNDDFLKLKMRGDINFETFVWKKGLKNWVKLKEINNDGTITNQETAQETEKISRRERISFRPGTFLLVQDGQSPIFGPFNKENMEKLSLDHRIDDACFVYSIEQKSWFLAKEILAKEHLLKSERNLEPSDLPHLHSGTLITVESNREIEGILNTQESQKYTDNEEIEVILPENNLKNGEIVFLKFENKDLKMEVLGNENKKNKFFLKKIA